MATGLHIDGGSTVFWGLVYPEDQPPTKKEVEAALREAGFDFVHNVLVQIANLQAIGAVTNAKDK